MAAPGWRAGVDAAVGHLQSAIDGVLAVVLAPVCAVCGELLEQPTRGPVCAACWCSILPLTPPLCDRCGDPLPAWRESATRARTRCPRCRRGTPAVDRARAIGAYDGALRAIVHALKYDGRRSLARPLGALDAPARRRRPRRRRRARSRCRCTPRGGAQRGFNQAADLARHLGCRCARRSSGGARRDADRSARRAAAPQRPRCVRAATPARPAQCADRSSCWWTM